jgi:MFS family permease
MKIKSRGKCLSETNFCRFYIGYSTSLLGTSMSSVAIAFALLDSGGTPVDLGIVFTANIVPMIVFMLGGGVLADRLGRRPVMLAADIGRFAAQAVLATAVGLGYPRVWVFVAAAFVVGIGNAFFQPALSGLPVQLVPRDLLGDANALLSAARPAAQVAGPSLAGVLIAVTDPATVIAADAATYAVSAVALILLRFPAGAAAAGDLGGGRRRGPGRARLRRGLVGAVHPRGPGVPRRPQPHLGLTGVSTEKGGTLPPLSIYSGRGDLWQDPGRGA